jgi:hypothetical protein
VTRLRRRQNAEVWLVLGLTLLLGAVQHGWRSPSGLWLFLYFCPPALLCPFVAAYGLSLRPGRATQAVPAVLVLVCLLGPMMGRVLGTGAPTVGATRLRVVSVNAQSWSADL